jgi:excisionase family DNA binding protein
MSDAADRLAQALRDLINETVQAAVDRERSTPPPARVSESPTVPIQNLDRCPWCHKKHMRHLMPVKEARQQLGGISPSTFYALVKEGELSIVKIGSRSFVQAEDLDDFVRRKRLKPSAPTKATGLP